MKMLIGTFEEKYKNTMLSVDAGFLFEFSSVMSQKFCLTFPPKFLGG